MDLIIITNGPGELASWVKSTVSAVKNKNPHIRISIFLAPCPFSSGQEERVAREIPGVDIVLNPRQFIEFLISGKTKEFISSREGIVIFLGGDPFHAVMVAKRTGLPAIAYTVKASSWSNYFRYCLVPDEYTGNKLIRAGTKPETIKVVGNLSLECVKLFHAREEAINLWGLSKEILTIGLMPGSRPVVLKHSLAYFMKVSEEVYSSMETQFILALSPYITVDILKKSLSHTKGLMLEGTSGEVQEDEKGIYIKTEGGIKIRVIQNKQYDVMNCCDLLLTLPGTINTEAGSLGIPMVICYSYNKPEDIPVGGMTSLLGKIPITGPFLKYIIWKMSQKEKFFSLPNRMAGEEIVPEIRVLSRAKEVSSIVLELLQDIKKRQEMSEKLKNLFMREGAGDRVADIILEAINNR